MPPKHDLDYSDCCQPVVKYLLSIIICRSLRYMYFIFTSFVFYKSKEGKYKSNMS